MSAKSKPWTTSLDGDCADMLLIWGLPKMGDKEPELPPDSSGKSTILQESGAKSGAPGETTSSTTIEESDLAKLMALWTQLPGTAQSAILALASAAGTKRE
jgi:hypothetical protein